MHKWRNSANVKSSTSKPLRHWIKMKWSAKMASQVQTRRSEEDEQHPQVDVTAAIALRRQNGGVDPMAQERSAMHAASTTQNLRGNKTAPAKVALAPQTCDPKKHKHAFSNCRRATNRGWATHRSNSHRRELISSAAFFFRYPMDAIRNIWGALLEAHILSFHFRSTTTTRTILSVIILHYIIYDRFSNKDFACGAMRKGRIICLCWNLAILLNAMDIFTKDWRSYGMRKRQDGIFFECLMHDLEFTKVISFTRACTEPLCTRLSARPRGRSNAQVRKSDVEVASWHA